jgi:predicted Fe-S protein YdhL (DUF1289 family)
MTDQPTPTIATPCIKLCVIEPDSGYCIGCGRTRDEIASWIGMRPDKRESVMLELPDRLANLTRNKRRKGGRTNRLARP